MTKFKNPKQKTNHFKPIWNLVLGICDFSPKTPGHSHLSLTWPKGPGFSRQNIYRDEFKPT